MAGYFHPDIALPGVKCVTRVGEKQKLVGRFKCSDNVPKEKRKSFRNPRFHFMSCSVSFRFVISREVWRSSIEGKKRDDPNNKRKKTMVNNKGN